ncbi:MAG: NADPH-dependent glutamate synthase [Promethearchaeota archaeon]
MIEQFPNDRIKNFKEVPKGYTTEIALLESSRCLQCGNPLCITGCPVNIDIPEFIRLIRKERFREAAQKILETNSLPAVCGRVCPQENQCEGECLLGKRFKPISIGNLERFVADFERNNRSFFIQKKEVIKNIKVAILGSGPASLTVAGDLVKLGYDVTIYEAFHKGGGVLAYGIPEFRLPKNIVDSEIEYIKSLGVNIEYNVIIGKTLTIDDLKAMGYEVIFIGIGAGLPIFLGIPGENLKGIISANEFLTRANLMKAYRFPNYNTPIRIGKKVIVIGGGNVALDSARTALRLGAEKVIIIYRRSEVEMPARREEYHHALEEGIEFQFLTNPIRFIGDHNGNVKEIEVVKMRLGDLDQSGRRRPIPIENSEYFIDADTIIVALGTKANPILTRSIPDLKLNKWGYIETDEDGQTNLEGIFAGGDIVTGSATVISAMGAGKKAAVAIDKYIKKKYKEKNK